MNKMKIYLYEDKIGSVSLVDHMGTDLTVINSARVSFGKHKSEIDAKDKKLINYLLRHKHTSTLEHNVITFRFKVPLFVRSQHHRHRTWSYNEISRRYTDFNIQFYEPSKFRTQHKSNRQASNESELINPIIDVYDPICSQALKINCSDLVRDHHLNSLKLFDNLISSGVCREQARGVLPQNMYTEYYGTTNLNNLLKFINLRIDKGSQCEIQKVAQACKTIAKELFPLTMQSYEDLMSS